MKYFIQGILFLILQQQASFAQLAKTIPEYGNITIADLEMKDCSFAPGSAAINLLNYEDITLNVLDIQNYSSQIFTRVRHRIKILKKSGFKYANISIDYNSKGSKIAEIEGATYNLDANGQIQISRLSKSDIYKIKDSKKNKNISFTFPNVKEGSIIEYQYTWKNKNTYYIPSWYFQTTIPNVLSVCKITRPYFCFLQKKVTGDWPVQEDTVIDNSNSEEMQLVNYYAMNNIPAFEPEPFMSSSRDYKYRIDFLTALRETKYDAYLRESNNIWQRDNAWLLGNYFFGGQFDAEIPGTKKLIDSVKSLREVSAKISAIYNYVKQKIRWNNYYFPLSREMKEVWEEGEGTSGEINLSILNLLRKCNVVCFPVLYSTRQHGKVDYSFNNISQFNTVNIAVVNGKRFNLLDGTSPYLSYDVPPFNVVNRTGMLIDYQNHTKITIDFDRTLLRDSIFVYATIDSNGIIKGKIIKKYFDLAKSLKLETGEQGEDDEENDKDEKKIRLNRSEITIDSSFQLDKENELLPLTEILTFHYEVPYTNGFYFLNPFPFSNFSKNPFLAKTRNTDIDFGAGSSSVVEVEIALPKEIMAEELAKNKEMFNADSSIIFNYRNEIKNDIIYIHSNFAINHPIFEKSGYPDVKFFFDGIYALLNNQIPLKRK
jgi:Domain of Unknown Function with PDB structure (DUF3857)